MALILPALLALPFLVWFLDTTSPVEFVSARAIPESGRPGASVMTEYLTEIVRDAHTCRPGLKCDAAECSIDAERSWIDAEGREWPSTTVHLGYNKGTNPIGLTMVIPSNAAAGMATVANAILWSCDPLRIFHHREPMPPLEVMVTR